MTTQYHSSLPTFNVMVLVVVFCFWFSLRLGSIIIAIVTSIQCCALLTMYGIWMLNPKKYISSLHQSLEESFGPGDIIKNIEDLTISLTALAILFAALLTFSLLLIIASLKSNLLLMYPFLIVYPAYVFFCLVMHVTIMMILKRQEVGIGELILYSNVGAFIILFLGYMWVCVYGFIQIINELRAEVKEREELNAINPNRMGIIYSPKIYQPMKYIP